MYFLQSGPINEKKKDTEMHAHRVEPDLKLSFKITANKSLNISIYTF